MRVEGSKEETWPTDGVERSEMDTDIEPESDGEEEVDGGTHISKDEDPLMFYLHVRSCSTCNVKFSHEDAKHVALKHTK